MVFIRRPRPCVQIEMLLGKRFQKILRVEEITDSSNPCSLEATFKNAFRCLYNDGCGDSIDVSSASRSTTLFASFADDHIYQEDLSRAPALIHRLRRGSVRVAHISERRQVDVRVNFSRLQMA